MTDSSQGNIVGSGLLGKLLLPSYTDAGANSSFQSSSRGVPSDQGSQAATEVRDNRSSIKQQFRMNCSKHHHSCPDATNTASSTVFSPSQVGDVEAKYAGFFPSTKPQLSPRPSSPPSLPRQRTLIMSSAHSMAGTSVVPETGAFHFSLQDTERLETLERALEKENQRRVYYWENERSASAEKNNLMLNAANLYRVEKDRERQRASPTNSSSHCSPRPNRNTSLLNDDDVGSDVMSTASEMGTVIELGNNAARMAEIDAMAALIEASPNIDALTPRSETSPPAPSRMSQRRTAEDTVASLALPELDSTPNEAIILARQTTANSLTSTLSTEQDKKEQFSAANPTPAELLSLALRRIGTGLNKTKASLSAPPTPKTPILPPPPRVEDLLKVSLTPRGYRHNFYEDFAENLSQDLPPSLALRSPGSSARLSLRRLAHQQQNSETKAILAPRFSPTDTSKILRSSPSFDSALSNDQTLKVKSLSSSMANMSRRESTEPLKLNPLSPFRLAQKCFSYDSTWDEALDTGSATGSATSSHILNLESSYPFHRQTEYNRKHKIKESVSWDVGGASGAFRVQPHRSHRIGALRPTTSQIEHNAQRVRVHSDFSPGRLENVEGAFRENQDKLHARHSHHQGTVLQLQTPDRFVVDVEREDALDILACLVERGVAAWNEESNKNSANESTESSTQMREALIANMVEELRMSRNDGEECQDDNVSDKIMALEELLKTHSYATEMKRAALSASTWLRSIGRGPQILNDNHVQDSTMNVFIQPLEVGQASGEDAGSDKQSDTNSSFLAAAADSKMEILTLKARLHSCESELREKMIVNQKLDEELCKCRAEIGRLRTASRNEVGPHWI